MRGGGAGWWILTAALWAAALLTKELAAVLPIVLFAYDRLVLADGPQEKRRRLWRLHGPLVGLAVAAAAARLAIFGYVEHSGTLTFRWLAILDQAIVTWRYAALLVNPAGQAIYHQVRPVLAVSDVRAIAAAAALAAVVAAACFAKAADRVMRFGVIWFVLLLAPSALLYILGNGDAMAEHRVYLASAGLLLVAGAATTRAIAWLSSVSRWHPALARAVIVVTLLSLAGRTVIRNVMWGDAVTLWREASLMAPDDPLPHTVLGEELDQSGRYQEAAEEYRAALRLKPDDPLAYLKLGVCLATLGKFDEARAVFEQLRSVAPESPYVPLGHGAVALMSGQPDRARTLFTDVLRRYPDDVMTLQWLALLEEEAAADPAAALRRCEEIQNLTPGRLSNEDCIRRNRARLTAVSAGRR
jgi:Flp pilus assembly protein TadD